MLKLKQNKIIDQWSALIEDAQGKGDEIFSNTEEVLKELEVPKLVVVRKKVFSSLIKRLKKETKICLVVSNTYLNGYVMYIGAMDYGRQLFVSWYLTLAPNKFWDTLSRLPWPIQLVLLPVSLAVACYYWITNRKMVLPQFMDVFDLEELTAYVTTVHHAVKDASEEVSKAVDFDFTKVDQKSRGFLNIS